jgi:PPP family 3-phenylpropionic acid transporter
MIRLYQFPFLKGLGAPQSLMGFALMATCISEIPMFILSTRVNQLDVVPVLFLSLVCYTVRMAGYSMLTDPLWTLPLELLHGCSIGLGLGAAIRFMHGCVPHEMASSALGVLSGIYTGLGPILGSLLGGFLFSAFGPHEMWRIGSILATIGTILVAVAAYRVKRNKAVAAETPPAGKIETFVHDEIRDAILPDDVEMPTLNSHKSP